MRVMCIREIESDRYILRIPFGEIVTVYEVVQKYYKIVEYPMSKEPPYWAAYNMDDFAPLSNLDELELVNEKEMVC